MTILDGHADAVFGLQRTPQEVTERLLPLALQALTDADARAVLTDAMQESGWIDVRVVRLTRVAPLSADISDALLEKILRYRVEHGLTERTARAVAAVLLFGSWRTAPWPLVLLCVVRARVQTYQDARIFVNGVELEDVGPLTLTARHSGPRADALPVLPYIEFEFPFPGKQDE